MSKRDRAVLAVMNGFRIEPFDSFEWFIRDAKTGFSVYHFGDEASVVQRVAQIAEMIVGARAAA